MADGNTNVWNGRTTNMADGTTNVWNGRTTNMADGDYKYMEWENYKYGGRGLQMYGFGLGDSFPNI